MKSKGKRQAPAVENVIKYLSFSRLKNLDHSPRKLQEYLNRQKKKTAAIIEGSVLDCHLFTPGQFDTDFFILPPGLVKPSKSQLEAKNPSDNTLRQIDKWNEVMSSVGKRTTITQLQATNMKMTAKYVQDNPTVVTHGLLNPEFFNFQENIDFFYRGFKHVGKLDASGHDRMGRRVIWDLKRMGKASGEKKVRWEIRQNLLDLQAAIYCYPFDSIGEPVIYYIIAVDNEGYVTPFRLSRDDRDRAAITWNRLIKGAHQCNMSNDLSDGPDFWADWEGFFDF